MPQTRFVLRKAFECGLNPVVVVNKIDRPDARPQEVLNEIYDLFIDLDAAEEQLDFPVLYTNAREGTASHEAAVAGSDLRPLFEAIVQHIPTPRGDANDTLQILIANLDSSDYLGRITIGRIFNGRVKVGDPVSVCKLDGSVEATKITKLLAFDGLKRVDVDQAAAGDIVCLAGIEDITIGETVAEEILRILERYPFLYVFAIVPAILGALASGFPDSPNDSIVWMSSFVQFFLAYVCVVLLHRKANQMVPRYDFP